MGDTDTEVHEAVTEEAEDETEMETDDEDGIVLTIDDEVDEGDDGE